MSFSPLVLARGGQTLVFCIASDDNRDRLQSVVVVVVVILVVLLCKCDLLPGE